MKGLWDYQKDLLELLVNELPYKQFIGAKEIIRQMVDIKEIYADDECHCDCDNCKNCKNK